MSDFDDLHPHQAKHVQWLLERPKAMLAWEMGVGKTATLLRAFELSRDLGPALVLCLNTAKENWRREALRFAYDPKWPPKVVVYDGGRAGRLARPKNFDIMIVNYDKLLLWRDFENFRSYEWGVIICDEAHALKSSDAKRTRVMYGFDRSNRIPLRKYTKRVWLATGTPMPNHPGELYSHCRALWPELIQYKGHMMEQWEFEAQYCEMQNTMYGPTVVGGRNLRELRQRLDPVISVIKRKDVLDLPTLTIETWALDAPLADNRLAKVPRPDVPGLLGTLELQYGSLNDIDTFDRRTLDLYLACIQNALNPLPTVRRETAQLKAVFSALTIMEEIDEDGKKVVVFAHHREAIATLEKALKRFNPAVVHGDVPEAKRQLEIDRFQLHPDCKVFIGQIGAAGSSINLQAATKVWFVEASWTPGDNNQALSRVYRMGQTQPVHVRFAYLPNSVDEAVSRALARKTLMIEAVFGESSHDRSVSTG